MHPFMADQLISQRREQALADAHRNALVRACGGQPVLSARPALRRRVRVLARVLIAALVASAGPPAEPNPDSYTSSFGTEPECTRWPELPCDRAGVQ